MSGLIGFATVSFAAYNEIFHEHFKRKNTFGTDEFSSMMAMRIAGLLSIESALYQFLLYSTEAKRALFEFFELKWLLQLRKKYNAWFCDQSLASYTNPNSNASINGIGLLIGLTFLYYSIVDTITVSGGVFVLFKQYDRKLLEMSAVNWLAYGTGLAYSLCTVLPVMSLSLLNQHGLSHATIREMMHPREYESTHVNCIHPHYRLQDVLNDLWIVLLLSIPKLSRDLFTVNVTYDELWPYSISSGLFLAIYSIKSYFDHCPDGKRYVRQFTYGGNKYSLTKKQQNTNKCDQENKKLLTREVVQGATNWRSLTTQGLVFAFAMVTIQFAMTYLLRRYKMYPPLDDHATQAIISVMSTLSGSGLAVLLLHHRTTRHQYCKQQFSNAQMVTATLPQMNDTSLRSQQETMKLDS
jgi:hypothetical protein